MDFIKKYYIYGIYILVILVSTGLYIWGMLINSSNVQEYEKITSKVNTAANLGNMVVRENEMAFYKNNIAKAEEDKQAVINFCKMTSNRPYLFIKIFPSAPQDVSKQYYRNFAEKYCEGVDSLLALMHSGDKPSELEEKDYLENAKRTTDTDAGAGGLAFGRAGAGMGEASADEKMIFELRERRARDISVYANPETFVLYDFWKGHDGSSGTTYNLQFDSWYSQIAYWIQEDVALSVNKINSIEKTVKENPVKRLVEISFCGSQASSGISSGAGAGAGITARPAMMRGGMGMGRGGMRNANTGTTSERTGDLNALPVAVLSAVATDGSTAANFTNSITQPWTKRSCNDLTDVFHFSVTAVISSDKVNEFVNALQSPKANADGSNSRNQITVLKFDLSPTNIQAEEALGYYYGSGSLVQAQVFCEYVFFRSGYDNMIPETIKKTQNSTDPASTDTPTNTGLGGPGVGRLGLGGRPGAGL